MIFLKLDCEGTIVLKKLYNASNQQCQQKGRSKERIIVNSGIKYEK